MSYSGNIAVIPLGISGLRTDDPSTNIDQTKLRLAENVTLLNGRIERDFGSRRWNDAPMDAGIIAFSDWFPSTYTQRIMVVTKEGRVFRFVNRETSSEVLNTGVAPRRLLTTDHVTIASGGAEQTSNPRKLFIFTGNDPVQVIEGDGTTRRNITSPPADWTGREQPVKGILHRNRLVAFMGHTLYFSSATDHEDFTTTTVQFPVFPGESEGIADIFVYKGRLFVLKKPFGLYYVDDSDPSPANWIIQKLNGDFGGTSPSGTLGVMDDILIANNYGSMTSLTAVNAFGDVKSADLYSNLRIDEFLEDQLSESGGPERHCLYFAKRQLAYVSYRSSGGNKNDRIVQINFKDRSPQVTLITKDQPNCFALIKNNLGIDMPFYGSDDGYLYEMRHEDREVNGSGYLSRFETHDVDFSNGDPVRAEMMKNFDYIEVVYIPTGNFDITLYYMIDGHVADSFTFKVQGDSTLGEIKTDNDNISSTTPQSRMIPIGGQGRRIAIGISHESERQNFKLVRFNVYYKYTDNHQTQKGK